MVLSGALQGLRHGGFAGAAVKNGYQRGGVEFSLMNLGSAPIAAAAAKTNGPVRAGLDLRKEPLLISICSLTGLWHSLWFQVSGWLRAALV